MRTQQQIIRSQRLCGWFFVFLSVLSFVLAGLSFYQAHWFHATMLLCGAVYCVAVGRWTIIGAQRRFNFHGGSAGESGAGKLAPLNPTPPHHLQAAKDLSPSDLTHSLLKD